MRSGKRERKKQIFVAYAYTIFDRRDYRKVYHDLEKAYDVRFVFADEKITNMHIMQKIISYIRSSDFSIFDISGWNPNVTLELGYGMGENANWYIAFNPEKTDMKQVPSDLQGIDRIEYHSFSELSDKLNAVLEQNYPKTQRRPVSDFVEQLEGDALKLIKLQPGIRMNMIASTLGVNVTMAQAVARTLLEKGIIEYKGERRGAKYYLSRKTQ